MPEKRPIIRRLIAALALCLCAQGPLLAQDAGGPVLSVSSLRLALMQLATGVDADVSELVRSGPDKALYLQSGNATLSDLVETAAAQDLDGIEQRDEGQVRLTRPLVLLQGATLVIGAGDDLVLDRSEGAFVLSLGRLTIDGARIESTGQPFGRIDGFRPFFAGVGRQSLLLANSTLSGLGYGASAFTGGVFIGGRGLLGRGQAGDLSSNTFTDVRQVTLSNLDGIGVTDNRFDMARGTALKLLGGSDITLTGNVFSGTRGPHALHLSGVREARASDNRFDFGGGKAVRIDDGARRVTFGSNRVAGFEGTAVTVAQGALCVRLTNNDVHDNIGGGIALRQAGSVIVDGNEIDDNRGAGIAIEGQQTGSRIFVISNAFAGNRMGLRGTGLAEVRLARNDLSDQMPRLLAGDLDQATPTYLEAARGGARPDVIVDRVSARVSDSLRKDAADRAFETCGQEGAS